MADDLGGFLAINNSQNKCDVFGYIASSLNFRPMMALGWAA